MNETTLNYSSSTTMMSMLGLPDIDDMNDFGPTIQLFLIIMYAITAILSFLGNTTVIIVMMCGKKSPRDFKQLLINLAVSDITMAVFCIPFTYTMIITNRWIFPPALCPVIMTIQHLSVTVSVYTLTVIGIDRYYAIMYPLRIAWTRSHGKVVIAMVWLLSFLTSFYQIFNSRAMSFEWGDKIYYECHEKGGKVSTIFVFCNTFLIPLIIMTFCYTKICRELNIHKTPGNTDVTRDTEQRITKIKAIKMLTVVVVLFALCWLPLHLFMFIVYLSRNFSIMDSENQKNVYIGTFLAFHWLAMANSFVNPIIYSFMCENFRTDTKNLFMVSMRSYRSAGDSQNGMWKPKTTSRLSTPKTSIRLTTGNTQRTQRSEDNVSSTTV